jgi:hypothetical protein
MITSSITNFIANKGSRKIKLRTHEQKKPIAYLVGKKNPTSKKKICCGDCATKAMYSLTQVILKAAPIQKGMNFICYGCDRKILPKDE